MAEYGILCGLQLATGKGKANGKGHRSILDGYPWLPRECHFLRLYAYGSVHLSASPLQVLLRSAAFCPALGKAGGSF